MTASRLPAIDSRYTTSMGESFVVIGLGTHGIVIEYRDGRVELVSRDAWRRLDASATEEETQY